MPDVTDLRPGDPEEIAGYRIVSRLGSGGQGVVYLAADASGQRVAIKQLRFGPEDERARAQFAKEVAAARLVAPFCTAQVLDADLEGPSPYVVSEYIEGLSLQQRIQTRGPMADASLHRLAIGTATALAAIHQAGVVHRDFKPANVMLAYDGPRVIDFGIARDLSTETTVTSRVFGTPAYMAPEQLRAERVGPATDMFAWASVIAYAATGQAPFEAPHMAAVMHRISSGEPDLSGVPADLIALLQQCLNKDPNGRPTAQQALALLLGRSAPLHDASDATQVLAEATGIVHAAAATATTQDPPLPKIAPMAAPVLPADPTVRSPTPAAWPPAAGSEQAAQPVQAAQPEQAARSEQAAQPEQAADPEPPTIKHEPAQTIRHDPEPTARQEAPAPTVQRAAPTVWNQDAPRVQPSPAPRPWGDGNVVVPPPGSPNDRRARNPLGPVAIVAAGLILAAGAWLAASAFGLVGDNGSTDPIASPSSSPQGADPGTKPSTEPTAETTTEAEADPTATWTAPEPTKFDGIPEAFDGTWEGYGLQPKGKVHSWSVKIELDEGETTGKMKLESLDCSGTLTLTTADQDVAEFVASMDDNPKGTCAAVGGVRLTRLSDDRMSFLWQDSAYPDNTATGQLRRN